MEESRERPAPAEPSAVLKHERGPYRADRAFSRSEALLKTTAYAHPQLIVQKSKLRPDQIEYMERKCREPQEEILARQAAGD